MLKNRLKLSMAAAITVAGLSSSAVAGTVTAPNIDNIELSGDIELKQVQEKSDTATINKRTAEINLNLDAKSDNGLEIYTTFTAYDDNQANAAANKDLRIKHAYAVLPIMDSKGKVVLGLAPNFTYGTDAFDDGGESWKVGVNVPVAKDIKVTVISKIVNEEEADKNKGDTGATAIRVDAKVGAFMIGARYAKGYANKGDGNTPAAAADKENKNKVLTSYITGTVAGIELGAEYMSKKIDMIGVSLDPSTQKGYFLTASSEVSTGFTAGLSYINLKKGMKGGDDFAPGMIFEKTSITSSATKDTSAYIIPLSYAISDDLTANATYINADIQGVDATEMDLGLEYGFSDNVTLSIAYGDFDGETGCTIDDTKNLEVAIAITF